MNKKILIGSIIAVTILIGVSFTSVVGYRSVDIPQENDTLQLESEFQRIRAYIEFQSDEDCGCDDSNTTEWGFPVLCTLLYPLLIVSFILVTLFSNSDLYHFMEDLARTLGCYWANPNPEI